MKISKEAEKVYLVEFNIYTNCCYDTVSDQADKFNPEPQKTNYLHIPLGGLLVRESDLPAYAKFGGGFKSIKLVGSMYFSEE